MSNFQLLTINEVTEKLIDYRGKTPPKTKSGVRLVTAKIVKNGRILNENNEYIASNFYDAWMRRGLPKKGDILITTEAPLGEVAQIKTDEKIALAQRIILLRGKNDVINQNYYFHALMSEYVQSELSKRSQGVTVTGIKQSELLKVKVPVFNLNCQQKIASILSAYDDLIENNNKRIKILEEIAKSIYKNYFLKDNNSFKEYKLSDLVSTQYGYTESAKNEAIGPHYLRGTDINKKSYIVWDEVPYCPISENEYKKYKLEIKDILIIRMADPGKIGIVEKEIDAVFASYLIRLRIVKNIITPYYLFYFLNSEKYQNYINGASNGTTRQSASAKVITDIKIPVPNIDLLNSFEEKVGKIRELISNLVDKNEMLTKAKNLLLPKLISGELDVEGLDIKIRPEIL